MCGAQKLLIPFAALLLCCTGTPGGPIGSVKTEPEPGDTIDRPLRSLRVWFDREPDVEASSIELSGPDGDVVVEGIHTMGDDDLMVSIAESLSNGEYTARWTAAGFGGEVREGEWTFSVDLAGEADEVHGEIDEDGDPADGPVVSEGS